MHCPVLKDIFVLAGRGEPVLETCKQLLNKFGVKPEQYQIGRTKLFFRAGVLGQLEDAATRINKWGPLARLCITVYAPQTSADFGGLL